MTSVAGSLLGRLFSYASLAPLLLLPGWSAGADYALIMPRAETSLLLDIDRAGEHLVMVGERGHVLHSDDEGEHWQQARVPTSVMLTRLHFVNGELGWAVGHDGNILFTEDAGVNWQLQRDGLAEQTRLREAREVMQEPVYPLPLMDVWFASEERGWAVGAFGVVLRTSNSGRFWDDWSHKVDNPEELHFNGIAGDAAGTLYLASEWGYVFRSTTSGESWEAVETGYDGSFFGLLVNPVSGSVFAYGLRGTIYRSTDGGSSWQALDTTTNASLFGAASSADGTLVFVGNDGTAVATRNDGNQFFNLQSGTRRRLNGVTFLDADRVVAAGDGGSTGFSLPPRPRSQD